MKALNGFSVAALIASPLALNACHSLCGPMSCPSGCCDVATNTCRAGNAVSACGNFGGACRACNGSQMCQQGACLAPSCESTSCGGDSGSLSDSGSTLDGGPGDGGNGLSDGGVDAGSAVDAGPLVTIELFNSGTRVSGVPTAPNYRNVSASLSIPDASYANIRIHYNLTATCMGSIPSGQSWPTLCDPFDRISRILLNDPIPGVDGGQTPLLLLDAMTPFGGNASWEQDVTDYASVLMGTHNYSLFISTGADSTGKAMGSNAGWDVEAYFILTPGSPPRQVLGASALFFQASYSPATPPLSVSVPTPAASTQMQINLYTTGHGAVGAAVCDEFCQKTHHLTVDGTEIWGQAPWLDCSNNCTSVSSGPFSCDGSTFTHTCQQNPMGCPDSVIAPRAGWCPSQQVALRSFSVALADAGTRTIGLTIDNVAGYFVTGATAVFYR